MDFWGLIHSIQNPNLLFSFLCVCVCVCVCVYVCVFIASKSQPLPGKGKSFGLVIFKNFVRTPAILLLRSKNWFQVHVRSIAYIIVWLTVWRGMIFFISRFGLNCVFTMRMTYGIMAVVLNIL